MAHLILWLGFFMLFFPSVLSLSVSFFTRFLTNLIQVGRAVCFQQITLSITCSAETHLYQVLFFYLLTTLCDTIRTLIKLEVFHFFSCYKAAISHLSFEHKSKTTPFQMSNLVWNVDARDVARLRFIEKFLFNFWTAQIPDS